MPPALSSQAKAPHVPLDLARANDPERPGVTCEGLLERFAGKAREICGVNMPLDGRREVPAQRPVEFEAINWMAFSDRGRLVLQFEVHGGNFLRLHMQRQAEGRFLRAAVETLTAEAPKSKHNAGPRKYIQIAPEKVTALWARFRAGEASLARLARELGCSEGKLVCAFERQYGPEYALVRNCYRGGTPGERVKARIDQILGTERLPVTKPNGRLL
jgi:hypothetical protein